MKTYEIAQEWAVMAARLDAAETDEEREAVMVELRMVEGALNSKLDAMAAMIKNFELEGELLEAEAKKLKERAESRERRAQSLKDYVHFLLMGAPWKGSIHAFGYRKSEVCEPDGRVLVTGDFLMTLPADCRKEVHEIKPSISGIKAALKAGEFIPGFQIREKQNLVVK
jgi:hypothetical protein